jgi:alkanesulfonate monooxygenase SsuD/methylene tetrahydromethanopterin reductase-like flavin-dependent oxidoreductase (luciferase family)
VALAAAAAATDRAELFTTVLNVPWRQSALMLAKQLWSLERISGGRLIAGLALERRRPHHSGAPARRAATAP